MKSIQALQSLEQVKDVCQRQGCTADQLHQMRADLVGPEAADRLQTLDDQRAAWKGRVDEYLAQREVILANSSYTDGDKQTQIQQLQQNTFTTQEQLRLPAFEQMHDQPQTAH